MNDSHTASAETQESAPGAGPIERRCVATVRSTGLRCRKWAIKGSTVCPSHGGRAPQVKAAAARRLALGEAVKELDRLGRPIEVDPATAMLDMVYEAAGNVAVLRQLVQGLRSEVDRTDWDPESGDEAPALEAGGIAVRMGNPNKWNEAAPHVFVAMYDAERERLVKWAKACRDAGVDERIVELREADARRIATVLTTTAEALVTVAGEVLVELGLEPAAVVDRLRLALPSIMRTAITTTATEGAPT